MSVGATFSDHVRGAVNAVSNGWVSHYIKTVKDANRKVCIQGRELGFVLALCSALKRVGGSVTAADVDTIKTALMKHLTGLTPDADCYDAEMKGYEKLKTAVGDGMDPEQFEQEFMRIYEGIDTKTFNKRTK